MGGGEDGSLKSSGRRGHPVVTWCCLLAQVMQDAPAPESPEEEVRCPGAPAQPSSVPEMIRRFATPKRGSYGNTDLTVL